MKVYMSHEKTPLIFHYTALRLQSAKRKNGGWKATFLLEGEVDFCPPNGHCDAQQNLGQSLQ